MDAIPKQAHNKRTNFFTRPFILENIGLHFSQDTLVAAFPKSAQLSIRVNQGDLEAQVTLGDMFYEGKGGDSQNFHTAIHRYLHAAEQEDSESQRKVRLMYEYGAGVSRAHTKAVAWYLKAVAQRNGIAQNRIAYSHSKGQCSAELYQSCRLVHQRGGAGGHKSPVYSGYQR